jgi:hypothetical protein
MAALIFAAALMLRVLVPSGFMLDVHNGVPVIEICPDQAHVFATSNVASSAGTMPMADMVGMDMGNKPMPSGLGGHHPDHSRGMGSCPYSALALATLDPGFIDLPAIMVALAALALAIGRPVRLTAIPFLRPPLRGPPMPA